MRRRKPLTDEQKKFIINNYQAMTVEDMTVALSLQSKYRVQSFLDEKELKRKKNQLTDDQKEFIRNNYKRLSETELARRYSTNRSCIQRFKREEGLRVRTFVNLKPKARVVKGDFFNVNERWSWVI